MASKKVKKGNRPSREPRRETGGWHKSWRGNIPVALVFPNMYRVGMSNLGFQLVYDLINRLDGFVCERFFLDDYPGPAVSVESGRGLEQFPLVFFSLSFEEDFPGVVKLLAAAGLPLWSRERQGTTISPGHPLVAGGEWVSV